MGAGSDRFGTDGRKADGGWERGAAVALRENSGWGDVAAMMSAAGAGKGKGKQPGKEESVLSGPDIGEDPPGLRDRPLFGGLCVYVNGSTAPAVGDLKLKHLLAQHGAHVAIALARRSVTHVILGKANGTAGGAGGGLAGGKLQKEISRVGGKGVKFVGVEWVLESVKAGRRLPEASFGMGVARPAGVGSVHEMFGKGKEKGGA